MTVLLLSFMPLLLQCVAAILFYDLFQERSEKSAAFWAKFLILFLLVVTPLNLIPIPARAWQAFVLFLECLFFNLALYRGKPVFRLLITLLFCGCLQLLESLWLFSVLRFLSMDLLTFLSSFGLYTFCSAGTMLFLILLELMAKQFLPRTREHNTDWYLWLIPLFFVGGFLLLILFLTVLAGQGPVQNNILVACTVFLSCTTLLVIILIDRITQVTRLRAAEAVLRQSLETQGKNLEALSAAYSAQRKMTHDYNAHLLSLSGLLAQGQLSQAENYLQQLIHQQTDRVLAVNTHNAALDTVLNQKAFLAKKQNIDVHFVVNDLSGLAIQTGDLAVILGNLLDNAIEACAKLPEQQRAMEVKAILQDRFLFCVRNRTTPVKISAGKVVSGARRDRSHGYGLTNVAAILSKYDCIYDLSYQDGWFQALVELPNTEIP